MSKLFQEAAAGLPPSKPIHRVPYHDLKPEAIRSKHIRFGQSDQAATNSASFPNEGPSSLERNEVENKASSRFIACEWNGAPVISEGASVDQNLSLSTEQLPALPPHSHEKDGVLGQQHPQEPISSGFTSPNLSYRPRDGRPLQRSSSNMQNRGLLQSASSRSPLESDSDECHSSHGVRLIMGYSRIDKQQSRSGSIDSWLDGVFDAKEKDEGKTGLPDSSRPMVGLAQNCESSTFLHQPLMKSSMKRKDSYASSDKENRHPLPSTSPDVSASKHKLLAKPPSRFRRHGPLGDSMKRGSPRSSSSSTSRVPSSNALSFPARRRDVPPTVKAAKLPPLTSPGQNFTVHGDGLASALAKLSPSVQCHRKGRGAKRRKEFDAGQEDTSR